MSTGSIQFPRPIVWDAHACFPLRPDASLMELARYRASGVEFVSINVGMDMDSFEQVIRVLAGFRRTIASRADELVLVQRVEDIRAAQAAGKLALAFDLEGSDPLLGDLNLVAFYYQLGVRQMLLAYNKDNRASGGCMEGALGLTDFGRDLIGEMNRVGMLVDVSHISYRATMEAFEVSSAPVIFSHSNPAGLRSHARNISDEQILACARTGGVVGINGIGEFLGDNRTETVVRALEYVIDLVGPDHVGLGLDYVIDQQELLDYIANNPDRFPADKIGSLLSFVQPEQIPAIGALLARRGHSQAVVAGVMGGNFLRVAGAVWK